VQDNGIGIPPAELEGIFEMFVQLDSSKTRAGDGLGLGLTLARSLIELHAEKSPRTAPATARAASSEFGCL